jgi:hypothetical protein
VSGRAPEDRPAQGWARDPAQAPAASAEDADIALRVSEEIWSRGLSAEAAADAAYQEAVAEGRAWFVRLKVEEPATGFKDHNTVLGQWPTALDGPDRHDLIELPPYAKPFLTLVFPRPAWGNRAGDYASDLRSAQRFNARGRPIAGLPPGEWLFEIRADRARTPVVLSWDGPADILKRSRLIDRTTGKTLQPAAKAYARGYRLVLGNGSRAFSWRFLGGALPGR